MGGFTNYQTAFNQDKALVGAFSVIVKSSRAFVSSSTVQRQLPLPALGRHRHQETLLAAREAEVFARFQQETLNLHCWNFDILVTELSSLWQASVQGEKDTNNK